MANLQAEQEVNHATHNRVLLGHRGLNFHLAQLLVVEEYDYFNQHVHIKEIQLPYAEVQCKTMLILTSFLLMHKNRNVDYTLLQLIN